MLNLEINWYRAWGQPMGMIEGAAAPPWARAYPTPQGGRVRWRVALWGSGGRAPEGSGRNTLWNSYPLVWQGWIGMHEPRYDVTRV